MPDTTESNEGNFPQEKSTLGGRLSSPPGSALKLRGSTQMPPNTLLLNSSADFGIVNSLNSALPPPAPPVADPMVVGFSTPNEKSLISKAPFTTGAYGGDS